MYPKVGTGETIFDCLMLFRQRFGETGETGETK
jgi:hypothetical protein